MKNRLNYVFLFISLLFFLSACESWKSQKITESHHPLVLGYTGGEISTDQKVFVLLNKEINLNDIDTSKLNDIVDLYPSADYSVEIANTTTLSIKPSKAWKRGATCRFRVNFNKLFRNEKYDPFIFEVSVKRQAYYLEWKGFQSQSTNNPSINSLLGSINLMEPENLATIKPLLSAKQNGNALSIKWSNSSNKKIYEFEIENVNVDSGNSDVDVEFKGKEIGANENTSLNYILPDQSVFTLISLTNPKVSGEPYLLCFSDPINANQNVEGLFSLSNGVKLSVSVNKNFVEIYPSEELTETVTLTIDRSLQNYKYATLNNEISYLIEPKGKAPKVEFVSKSTIYPSGDKMIIPFKATSLRAVTVRIIEIYQNNMGAFLQDNNIDGASSIKRYGSIVAKKHLVFDELGMGANDSEFVYGLDISNYVKREPGSLYRVTLSFRKEFSKVNCQQVFNKEEFNALIADTLLTNKELAYFSDGSYWQSYSPDNDYSWDDYEYEQADDPCSDSFYMRDRSVSKTILVSDIGIIAKSLKNNIINIFTSSISTAKASSGIDIKAYNLQNRVVGEGKSNGDGFANIQCSQMPFYLVASNGKEYNYLKLVEETKQVTTTFNTNGAFTTDGIKGYLYGERGVWRPNDSIYLSFILQDAENRLPDGLPIKIQLFDTQGRVVDKQLLNKDEKTIYATSFHIPEQAKTGNWYAEALVGNSNFKLPVRVETIKPNRLKIDLNTKGKTFSAQNNSALTLKGNWLAGIAASNLKFDATYTLTQIENPFPNYSNYTFTSPFNHFEKRENSLIEGNLNQLGETSFTPQFNASAEAGLLKAKIKVRIFEPGGEFSTDFFDAKISPCSSYTGISIQQSNSTDYFPIKVITVDSDGNKKSVSGLNYAIYRTSWDFWYENESETQSQFVTSNSDEIVQKGTLSTQNGEAIIKFDPKTDDWGCYVVLVENGLNGNVCGDNFILDGTNLSEYYSRSKGVDDAQFVSIKPTKDKYFVGDKAEVTFPTSANSQALVTIEKAGKILKQELINCFGTSNNYKFEVTEDMTPNIYLSVSVLQPLVNTKNDMPVRMYGTANIFVENKKSRLNPIIALPAEVKPNNDVTIQVKEENGAECDYSLAIVDEGLLDLTHFETPNPFDYFFQKEAMVSQTYDIFNYVLGGYQGSYQKVFGIGGDMGALGAGNNQKASRFKPMVRYIGPFNLGSGKTNKHTISIPYYVGSVRVMVVAASEMAYGSSEKIMKVRNNYMVVSSLPRTLAPNDEIEIPVTILSTFNASQKVNVLVEGSKHFEPVNGTSKELKVEADGEATTSFRFKIGSELGMAKFKVIATSNLDKVIEDIDIEVCNPNAPSQKSRSFSLNPSEESSFTVSRDQWAELKSSLELSTIKSLNIKHRLGYLISYPHGCVEQTSSAAFPQLFLNQLVNLSNDKRVEIERHIKHAINRLTTFQQPDGGLSYWPSGNRSDDWGSSYGGHFLVEAKNAGYAVPERMYSNWIKFQKNMARNWSAEGQSNHGYYSYSSENQAYRLYTLARAGVPDLAALNRLRGLNGSSSFTQWLVAATYAEVGQTEVANDLIFKAKSSPQNNDSWQYNYGSSERNNALMLQALIAANQQTAALEVANYLTTRLNSNDYLNTQATAMSLIAMANYYEATKVARELKVTVKMGDDVREINSRSAIESIDFESNKITISNRGTGVIYGNITEVGTPKAPVTTPYARAIDISTTYITKEGASINPSSIKQGQDIIIRTTIRHLGGPENYTNIALTQIFPTGWEIRNQRMEEESEQSSALFTYQDIKDDRGYTYFDINRGESKTITQYVTPSFKGVFYMPAITCESMYNNQIAALEVGFKVIVE